ncbi:hypothetical protein AUJ46_01270 [Candidatus Peregrinibacteria bacterium CG1_02_54_53]|nr:MAG: hypothetical protein AUJ46_01270 [Candidatus Peregrinibacteria bacterium CG1_02_54_53]
MGLNGIGVSDLNVELGRVQAKNFYERSGLFVSMEQMHEYFFTVHPDWRPENFQATVMRMWQEGGCNGPSGDTRDWLNGVILDMMGRYDRDLNVYAAAVAEIMQKGVEVCLAVRQGQPEGPLLFELDQLITDRGYWEAVGRLAGIGVKLPTRQQVIAEAKHIVDDKILELLRTQSEDRRLIANLDLRQQNAQWMAARNDGLTNISVLGLRKNTADGYSPEELDRSEQRRLARAARLFQQFAGYGTDSRVRVVVAAANETNIQRKRQVAGGMTEIVITKAEADLIATETEKSTQENGGDATIVAEEVMANPEIEVIAALVRNLGTIAATDNLVDTAMLQMPQGGEREITFELTGPMMVNLWTDFGPDEPGKDDKVGLSYGLAMPQYPNLSLTLSGNGISYSSDKKDVSSKSVDFAGESVSTVLPAGTYTLAVRDITSYPTGTSSVTMPTVPVHYEIRPYTTQKIEGRISIAERGVTMPVSMSVAEFDSNTGLRLPEAKNGLDPQKPVWVVVHGRANSEESSQIAELTRSLQALGVQVVTVDWHDGAADNGTPIGLEGSRWIEGVGTWAANQLRAAGFGSQNICVVGHSWGTYVAYEIGKRIPNGVQTLIALDPAADSRLLGGGKYKGIEDPNFSFANVTANSYAFHSSELGNREKALTAKYAFDILAPENYEQNSWDAITAQMLVSQRYLSALGAETADEVIDAFREHGFAVSLFSEILRRQKENPGDAVASRFSPENLRSNASEFTVRPDSWEGYFYAHPSLATFTSGADAGKQAWLATAYQFYAQDENGSPILGN